MNLKKKPQQLFIRESVCKCPDKDTKTQSLVVKTNEQSEIEKMRRLRLHFECGNICVWWRVRVNIGKHGQVSVSQGCVCGLCGQNRGGFAAVYLLKLLALVRTCLGRPSAIYLADTP